jgi:hypothetical protein
LAIQAFAEILILLLTTLKSAWASRHTVDFPPRLQLLNQVANRTNINVKMLFFKHPFCDFLSCRPDHPFPGQPNSVTAIESCAGRVIR